MKTFKWTVPEFPMTHRERNPPKNGAKRHSGFGKLIIGLAFCLLSLMYLSTSRGFVTGISTYFWSSTQGRIISSNLRSHSTAGGGEVTYLVEIDGSKVTRTTEVFEKWSSDNAKNYEDWASSYESGNTAEIFFNSAGKTSLGHWPTEYSRRFGFLGVGSLVTGVTYLIFGATALKKANKILP